MRRPRREVAGGEMALMAVMTKAMGAFLVIMIMLLPYYTGDTAAQQTIDQTNEQIRKAGDDLAQVKQILGKGRLSDQEIDELIKKIEDAQKALDEARALVATLQVKLDQAQSQITRLEAENKALTAQVQGNRFRLTRPSVG
jgi:septal ring factor EnvC (AmiA/AmiB activator)